LTTATACAEAGPRGTRKLALLDLTFSDLQDLALSLGQPRYRADQLFRWLHASLAAEFGVMHNLPQPFREQLSQIADVHTLVPLEESVSADGLTRKVLLALQDGETIECVLMRYQERNTVCLSTQVGCPVGCSFCATGHSGFTRDLTPGEIVEQAIHFAQDLREERQRISNVVFMGMGEPFLNYEATWQAIETLTDPRGFNLGARRITISTVGIIPGIERLSRQKLQVGLAISLHAPNDELRRAVVPAARRYPIEELMGACRRYLRRTGRRITFEYALIDGFNDSPQQARELATLLKGLLCHVNLIPVNPVPESPWRGSPMERVTSFHQELRHLGLNSTIRLGRGIEIEAGCGQLRSRSGGGHGR
jgi:23S rRNA (adenine2503-C2)-methyltransferase